MREHFRPVNCYPFARAMEFHRDCSLTAAGHAQPTKTAVEICSMEYKSVNGAMSLFAPRATKVDIRALKAGQIRAALAAAHRRVRRVCFMAKTWKNCGR